MHQLIIEKRPLNGVAISTDITRHFYSRMSGGAAIVCDRPNAYVGAVRKKWWAIYRHLLKERSSTLDAAKIAQLTSTADHMLSLRFSARTPLESMDAPDVAFSTPAQLARTAPYCRTIYITCPVTREQLHLITALMPPRGLVVIYEND